MIRYQRENFGKSFDFRCRTHDRFRAAPHIHQFCELLYTFSGEMTAYIGGQRTVIPAGQMAFIMPNEIHAYTDETECRVLCAVYSADFVPGFFRQLGTRVPAGPLAKMQHMEETVMRLTATEPDALAELAGILNLLHAELLRQCTLKDRPKENGNLYRAATEYISQNFRTDITLRSAAAALGYHEKYLSSALHALTGMHFRTFLSSYRVEYACALLRAEEHRHLSIAEIAHESGFASINTFCREFRRLTGMSASEYRRGG